MLTKLTATLREIVSPKSDKAPSRKRKFQSDLSAEAGPSPAKRTRQDTPHPNTERKSALGLSQIADWFTRTSSSVREAQLFKSLFSPRSAMSDVEEKYRSNNSVTSVSRQPYVPSQQLFAKQSTYTPGLRPKAPPAKHMDPVISPGGHVVPPRVPRTGQYSYHQVSPQFHPVRPPNFSFAPRQQISSESFRFRAAGGDSSYARQRTPSSSHVQSVQQSMYAKLYGRKHGAIAKRRHKMAVFQSVRLDEKKRYAEILGSYMKRDKIIQKGPVKATTLGADIADDTKVKQVHPDDKNEQRDKSRQPFHSTPCVAHKPSPLIDLTDSEKSKTVIDLTEQISSEVTVNEKAEQASKSRLTKQPGSKTAIDRSAERESDGKTTPQSVRSFPRSPLNESLKERLADSKYATAEWIEDLKAKYSKEQIENERIKHLEIQRELFEQNRREWEAELERKLRQSLILSQRQPPVIEDAFIELIDSEEESEDIKAELPVLTEEEEDRVDAALVPQPASQVLTEGYKLQLTRADIATLGGLNWLNDEVINFYMNMLMERGEKDNYPSVHAFNTFFYPKIMSNGHAGVKRWTKRGNIDIFAKSYILVPVHLGMHWCLAVIDFTKKEIRYYDSMGGNNNACLNALKQYLEDESMDKKKQPYSTADWKLINVKDIPQQMNGSDCGMFACKFAEYISRGAPITFSQEEMPYFRRRMILELLNKQFMT